jgi:hypothetical protein
VNFETNVYDDGEVCFDGDVSFGDCTRTITWSEYSKDGMLRLHDRLSETVDVLARARRQLYTSIVFAEEFKRNFDKAKKKKAKAKKKK